MSYRVDPRQPLAAEIRRIASAELDKALGDLEAAREKPDKALHKCRKRLKNVRALLGLVRSGDQAFFRIENARYRDAAARLAGPREAAALIETIDRLAGAFPKEAEGGALAAVRSRLVVRRNGVLSDGAVLGEAIDAAAVACRDGLRQLGMLALPERAEQAADVLATGAGAALRRARKALAAAGSTGAAEDFHALRKAVKAHAMHLLLLRKLWPAPVRKRVKAVEALGEKLGELHDLSVLKTLSEAPERPLGKRGETRILARLLKRSEKLLRKACLAEADELFGESPRHQVKRLARKARGDLAGAAPAKVGIAAGAAN